MKVYESFVVTIMVTLFLGIVPTAYAGSNIVTLNPTQDAFIANTDYQTKQYLGLHCRADTERVHRSYLEFDLSGIDCNSIISVTLELHLYKGTVPPETMDVCLHETGELLNDGSVAWTESNIRWSNAPPVGALLTTTAVGGVVNWYSWSGNDVMNYVKVECAGDGIVSFAMKLQVEDVTNKPVYDRDFSDRESEYKPRLIITLEEQPPYVPEFDADIAVMASVGVALVLVTKRLRK